MANLAGSVQPVDGMDVSQPLNERQVKNYAGGYVYQVDDAMRLRRFLCLGSESGTYYVKAKKLGEDNVLSLKKMLEDGKAREAVTIITEMSTEGRTAKQDSILLCLALCARSSTSLEAKTLAYQNLAQICRIPTHLFMFQEYAEKFSSGSGWGRSHRRAISKWYNGFTPKKLAEHVTKYKSRGGWSHVDVLRLSHLVPQSDGTAAVISYVIKGLQESWLKFGDQAELKEVFDFLRAVDSVKGMKDASEVAASIRKFRLVREHIPTTLLNEKPVWEALLENMPMTAMIRNLGKMTSIKLFDQQKHVDHVCAQLRNVDNLIRARVHPFSVLVALKTYEKGSGVEGNLRWETNAEIVAALNDAFHKSFKAVTPTGKRFCLAVDVSGSMGVSCLGSSIVSCAEASAALCMVTARVESSCHIVAFSDHLTPVNLPPNASLRTTCDTFNSINMGGTNCALPMTEAAKNKQDFDVFVVFTDSETWVKDIHPSAALKQYRTLRQIPDAKLIVCGMASTEFTIADPNDPGMLDVVGFDSAAPQIMEQFVRGNI